MYAPNSSPYLPAEQWNVAEIRVLDNEVEHWLNDELVLQYNLKAPDFLQRKLKSKWNDDADWAKAGIGHISSRIMGIKSNSSGLQFVILNKPYQCPKHSNIAHLTQSNEYTGLK